MIEFQSNGSCASTLVSDGRFMRHVMSVEGHHEGQQNFRYFYMTGSIDLPL